MICIDEKREVLPELSYRKWQKKPAGLRKNFSVIVQETRQDWIGTAGKMQRFIFTKLMCLVKVMLSYKL